jgi:hypothetical protein
MIKGLMGSDGVFVENGNNSLPYHSPQQGDSFSGVLRLNGTDIQYYNNGTWTNLPTSYATVRMDPSITAWVREKQTKEKEQQKELEYLKRRSEEHPSLKKAYDAIIRAEERLNADIDKAVEDFKLLDKLIGEEQSGEYAEAVQASP